MTALSHCITCGEWTDIPCIYGGCPFRTEQAEYRTDQARDRAMIERWDREQGT